MSKTPNMIKGWFVNVLKMSIEALPCDVVLEVTVRVLVVCRSSEEGLVGGLDLFDPLPINTSPSLFHRCSYIAKNEILEGDTDNNKLLFSQSRCMCICWYTGLCYRVVPSTYL